MSDPTELPAADADRLDARLANLFAPVRPDAGLEDRVIASLRTAPTPAFGLVGWPKKLLATAAGLAFLGVVGSIISGGRLPLPGGGPPAGATYAQSTKPAAEADRTTLYRESQRQMAHMENDDAMVRTDESAGIQSNVTGALPQGTPNSGTAGINGGFGGGIGGGGLGGGGLGGMPAQPGTSNFSFAMTPPNAVQFSRPTAGPSNPPVDLTGKNPVPGYYRPAEGTAAGGDKDAPQLFSFYTGEMGDAGRAPSVQPPAGEPKPTDVPKPAASPPPPADPKAPAVPPEPTPNPEPVRRVVIRSGDIEFEVESFDSALAAVTKLVTGIKGAFVATVNSDKLPNGKVRGSVTVRTPPDALDGLVLDLRRELGKGGELKGVKLTSADITKQYTDLESRLRAARTMETRLLQIIKEGKGEIKQLLEAERELGVWRTKIEETEGELRYYANLAALSTLTITLAEKEARAAAGVSESERVQAGVEVEDVDKAYQAVLAAVLEAKGRVLRSEVKQLAAGQFNAALQFEVAPEASGPIRDRLRQLGRVARLEIDRVQQAEGGNTVPKDAKVRRGDTVFLVQLYNLANVAPRETAVLHVAAADVPKAYQALRDALAKVSGRVIVAQLNEQDKQNVTAQVDFEVKRADEGVARAALAAAGELVSRQVGRAPESDNVTDTKVLYRVTLQAAARLGPRETAVLQVAAVDVAAAYQAVRDAVGKAASGKVLAAQLNEQDRQNVTGQLDFEVSRADEAGVRAAVDGAGEVVARQVVRAAEGDAVTDAKVLYRVGLVAANRLPARESTGLTVEVPDVDGAAAVFAAVAAEAKARAVDARTTREPSGKASARLIYDVPLAAAAGLVDRFRAAGQVRAFTTTRNPQAPDGRFAVARVDVTVTGGDPIVGADDGVWPPIRKGLTYSASVLFTSLTWVVFGLCVVLPWALVGLGLYRLTRWATRPAVAPAAGPAPPPG